MKVVIIALFASIAVLSTASADTCMSKAVDKNGKPLSGAAKSSSVKKCVGDEVGM